VAGIKDKLFGKAGEEAASRYLKRLGYRILEQNYRTPVGELDIIAMDKDTLVFVEVKSRRTDSFGSPEDAVGPHKQRQMARAALMYMTTKKKTDLQCRFDVVGITASEGREPVLELYKDAFELAGGY
jgi:putative endonuclease